LSIQAWRWYNLTIANVAQLVEQTIRNRQVEGSIPSVGSPKPLIFGEISIHEMEIFDSWMLVVNELVETNDCQ
jgi:hypothetical protein